MNPISRLMSRGKVFEHAIGGAEPGKDWRTIHLSPIILAEEGEGSDGYLST